MHTKKTDSFDKQIKTKLESKAPVVPSELWNRISYELDKCDSESNQKEKILYLKNWKIWLSVASIICVLSTLGLLIKMQDQNLNTEINAATYTNNEAVPVNTDPVGDPNLHKNENPVLVENKNVYNSASQHKDKAITVYNSENKGENILVFNVEPSPIDSLSTKQHIEENPFVELQYAASKEVNSTVGTIENNLNEYEIQTAELLKTNTLYSGNIDTLKTTENLQFSNLLNFVISRVDKRQQKFVKFSNDDEGSIRIDFNLASLRK